MSDSVIRPSVIRGSVADDLHIRLFQVESLTLASGCWNAQNVRSPFWRLYRNGTDSAFLKLLNGAQYGLSAERIHFVPAGVSFSCGNVADFDHFYIHFDVLGMSSLMMGVLFEGPITLPANTDLENRMESMACQLKSGKIPLDLAARCQVKALVYESLGLCLETLLPERWERGIRAAERAEPVAPALRFIDANLSRPLTIPEIAACCCLSPDYFARRFRECVGETPGVYITHRRVTRASQQLLFTGDSLEKIASDCGFGSRFYLSRVFTRETGISPAAYRKTARV